MKPSSHRLLPALAAALFLITPAAAPAEAMDLLADWPEGWRFFDGETPLEVADAWALDGDELVCAGSPRGYLVREVGIEAFTLRLEWRWETEEGGNSGVLIHLFPASVGFRTWPPSLEVQLRKGEAGDFYVIGNKTGLVGEGGLFVAPGVPVVRIDRRENAETAPTEWQELRVESANGIVEVFVNGTLVNRVTEVRPLTESIALQSEGAPLRFRNLSIHPVALD